MQDSTGVKRTAPAARNTSDHQLRLPMLVPAIISLAKRTLLFPLWWSFTLWMLGRRRRKVECWGLGEKYWNRRGLRRKRVTLRARRVLVVIPRLIVGLMSVGELEGAVRNQLWAFLRSKRDATRLYDLSAEGRRTDHRCQERGKGKETYSCSLFVPVVGVHSRVDHWSGQGWVDWNFVCAI